MDEALRKVPTNYNAKAKQKSIGAAAGQVKITLGDLPNGPELDALLTMAESYGYEPGVPVSFAE